MSLEKQIHVLQDRLGEIVNTLKKPSKNYRNYNLVCCLHVLRDLRSPPMRQFRVIKESIGISSVASYFHINAASTAKAQETYDALLAD
ncbi:hypothetical protein L596_025186 [Steinernema carpocapsae]|uniref:Uncharacterized protein n=1 Tax=Steinernema carpocapsae TaxID=34508 RepID=A0A4U5M731_STECR|nr:hypothetical protein L596_025186 [Steinernema carpocapsae]